MSQWEMQSFESCDMMLSWNMLVILIEWEFIHLKYSSSNNSIVILIVVYLYQKVYLLFVYPDVILFLIIKKKIWWKDFIFITEWIGWNAEARIIRMCDALLIIHSQVNGISQCNNLPSQLFHATSFFSTFLTIFYIFPLTALEMVFMHDIQ